MTYNGGAESSALRLDPIMTDLTYDKVSLSKNKATVLGNAYAGLGLLMVPTAIGSYLTASLFSSVAAEHPIAFFIAIIVGLLGFGFGTIKNANSGAGFAFALGFAFFMGALMGPALNQVASHYKNGSTLITFAALGTAGLFVSLSAFVHITKKDFSGLGNILYAALWGLIIASLINIFLQSSLMSSIGAGFGVAIFSGYILYDTSEALHGRDNNWILVCLNLYLNVINLFMNLVTLLSHLFGSNDD